MMLRNSKRRLYDWLTSMWLRLDSTQVADLPGNVAKLALAPGERLAQWKRVYKLGLMALASATLTVSAAITGRIVRRLAFPDYKSSVLPASTSTWNLVQTQTGWLYDKVGYYAPAFIVNFVFDGVTLWLTFLLLRHVRDQRLALVRLLVLAANVGVASVLAVTCLASAYYAVHPNEGVGESLFRSWDIVRATLTMQLESRHAATLDDFFFAASTLIPITVFLLLLGVLLIAKALLWASRSIAAYWLELMTEPLPNEVDTKFAPFTLLGLLFGSIGVALKLVSELTTLAR
jgi:hypothetical protein